jgi:serine/threonine protein kinase
MSSESRSLSSEEDAKKVVDKSPPEARSATQRMQLLKHYADYFPDVLFTSDVEVEDALAGGGPVASKTESASESPDSGDAAGTDEEPGRANRTSDHMYILQQIVGRSQNTAAFVARRASDGIKVVAKIVILEGEKQTAYARSEVQCLAVSQHFGIVRHYDDFEKDNKILLVMEYGSGGDLNKQIKQRVKERLPFKEHEVGLLFFQIVLALHNIHSHRMIHRDLKSANIFLMSSGVIKIGDFGFSKQYGETVSQDIGTSFCGTPYYLAPELWERKRYSKKADMWSLGVILYELLTLHRPFKGPSQREIMQQVLYSTYDPFPCPVSEEMGRFLDQLLAKDPNARPSTRQLLQTEFLKYVGTIFEEIVITSETIASETKKEIIASLAATRSGLAAPASDATATANIGSMDPTVTHEGYLQKLSSDRRWKRRFLRLAEGMIRISLSDKSDGEGSHQSVSIESVTDVLPVPLAYSKNHPFQFVIWFVNGQKIIARAHNAEERDIWIAKLQAAFGV